MSKSRENKKDKQDYQKLWETCPSAICILKDHTIEYRNQSFNELIEIEDTELDLWSVIPRKHHTKIEKFLESNMAETSCELNVNDKIKYIRIIKSSRPTESEPLQLIFQDLTKVQENTKAIQAGYDEFLKVTIELENALKIINEQNKVLEQQKREIDNELRIAHILQQNLFEEDFDRFDKIRIFGYYEAMDALGGDMWDIYETGGEIYLVLGDVMGHGVASSLISIIAKTLFRKEFENVSGDKDKKIPEILQAVNRELLNVTGRSYYITTCVIRISADGQMEYATAGHPPIVLQPYQQPFQTLHTTMPMLGIFQNPVLQSGTVKLEPRSRVLIYTDCLIEDGHNHKPVLPVDQMVEVIHPTGSKTVKEAVTNLVKIRKDLAGKQKLPDDLAVICFEFP